MNQDINKVRNKICTNPMCNLACNKIHIKSLKNNNKSNNHKNKTLKKPTLNKKFTTSPNTNLLYKSKNVINKNNSDNKNINNGCKILNKNKSDIKKKFLNEKFCNKGFYLNINSDIIINDSNYLIIFDNIYLNGGYNDFYNTNSGVATIPFCGKYNISYNISFLWEKNNKSYNILTYLQVNRKDIGSEYLLTNVKTYSNNNIVSFNNNATIQLEKNDKISLYIQIPNIDSPNQIIKNFNGSTFFSCISI